MNKLVFVSIMIFVAAISRLIPHPGNFTPVMAIALFAGASILSKKESILIPMIAMLLSDAIIGFHDLMPVTYGCMALVTILGWNLQKDRSLSKTLGYGLFGTIFFFVVTNFAVWATSGMYTKDLAGLTQCYILAIPFFQNALMATILYGFILFGTTSTALKLELVKVKA